jgi:hypothetical protein
MITLTTAAWIALAIITLLSVLLMKATVRLVAKPADNGWDNAVAYVIASGIIAFACTWIAKQSFLLAALVPLIAWTAQTLTIRYVYEVRTARAWLIGTAHALVTSAVVTTMGLTVAFVAAYILYGKIISDPMFLLRLLLKWLGIELPFPI